MFKTCKTKLIDLTAIYMYYRMEQEKLFWYNILHYFHPNSQKICNALTIH